jgi:hypothetical protein
MCLLRLVNVRKGHPLPGLQVVPIRMEDRRSLCGWYLQD